MENIEQEIVKTARIAVHNAISESLGAYNSPLRKMVDKVLENHSAKMTEMVDSAVTGLIGGAEFKAALNEALNEKLAKTLIQRMGGELESKVNELKANPETRARITIAIGNIIKDL